MTIRTERLILRPWKLSDREPFAHMNADPEVMRFFPAPLTPAQSDAFAERIESDFARDGFGLFAVELSGEFIGYTGLAVPSFEAEFTPCVEIGWRLARSSWGQGLATEAARAVVSFAFDTLGLDEIVSFTVPANTRSRRVMEKIGMSYAMEFDHPKLAVDHPLRRHVLYRLKRTIESA